MTFWQKASQEHQGRCWFASLTSPREAAIRGGNCWINRVEACFPPLPLMFRGSSMELKPGSWTSLIILKVLAAFCDISGRRAFSYFSLSPLFLCSEFRKDNSVNSADACVWKPWPFRWRDLHQNFSRQLKVSSKRFLSGHFVTSATRCPLRVPKERCCICWLQSESILRVLKVYIFTITAHKICLFISLFVGSPASAETLLTGVRPPQTRQRTKQKRRNLKPKWL